MANAWVAPCFAAVALGTDGVQALEVPDEMRIAPHYGEISRQFLGLARACLAKAAIVIAPIAIATATIAIAAALIAVTAATIAVTTAAVAAASSRGLDCAHLQQGTACKLHCGCATPYPPDIGSKRITQLSLLLC